jgi:transmembrane sensor
MTDHPTSSAAPAVTDEAISWLIRLRDPACTRTERKQFEAWLAADISHAREYQSLTAIWSVSGNLQPTIPAPARRPAVIAGRQVAAAALLSLLLAGIIAWLNGWLPSSYRRYVTKAQTQHITLPDGSDAELGMRTSLTLMRFRDRDEVRFGEGEAFFNVRHASASRLDILVGNAQVHAAGAQFNLWYDDGRAVATPVQHFIEIQGDVRRDDQAVVPVSVGHQARFSEQAPTPRVSSANLEQTLAWRRGKLLLSDLALADALPLINRYLDHPLGLGDEAAGEVRIGGVYSTSDIEGLVRALPRIAPVRILGDDRGSRTIYSAPRRKM